MRGALGREKKGGGEFLSFSLFFGGREKEKGGRSTLVALSLFSLSPPLPLFLSHRRHQRGHRRIVKRRKEDGQRPQEEKGGGLGARRERERESGVKSGVSFFSFSFFPSSGFFFSTIERHHPLSTAQPISLTAVPFLFLSQISPRMANALRCASTAPIATRWEGTQQKIERAKTCRSILLLLRRLDSTTLSHLFQLLFSIKTQVLLLF